MTAPTAALLVGAVALALLAAGAAAGRAAVGALTRTQAQRLAASGRPAGARAAALAHRPDVARRAGAWRLALVVLAVVALTVAIAGTGWVWWQVALAAAVAGVAVLGAALGWADRLGERHPVAALALTGGLLRLLARRSGPAEPPASHDGEDDLREMVERAHATEHLEEEDREMVRSVLELGETIVREVMVPRTEMVTVAAATPLRKALTLFLRSGYSRVPVTGESVDDLLGVVYLKDVVRRLHTVPDSDAVAVVDLARPAEFVPESKPVDDLLRAMQAGSFHIAMVVDEFGGIAGLVTVEDAIEEIVGELTDEHDHAAPEVEDLGDGSFRIPARLPLDDLGDLFGLEIADDDVDTAAGLLAKALGKVPLAGSGAEVAGLVLRAERAEGRRRRLTTLIAAPAAVPAPEGDAP